MDSGKNGMLIFLEQIPLKELLFINTMYVFVTATTIVTNSFKQYRGDTSVLRGCPRMEIRIRLSNIKIYARIAISGHVGGYTVSGVMSEDLVLMNSEGTINVTNSDVTNLNIQTESGNIRVNRVTVTDTATLITNSGSIGVNHLDSVQEVIALSKSGSIHLTTLDMKNEQSKLTATTEKGDIDVTTFPRGSIASKTDSGNTNINISKTFKGSLDLHGNSVSVANPIRSLSSFSRDSSSEIKATVNGGGTPTISATASGSVAITGY
jgi:DUF4097 and DUF4098 domain-containing protein YvlB